MRVLLVDNDVAMLRLLQRMLAHAGHDVQTADSPYGATATVQRFQPHVVVLDVMMPGLQGTSLAEIMLKTELKARPVIVLYSAMPDDELRKEAQRIGVQWVSKTKGPGEIVAHIERCAKAPIPA
jgi:DNA-binding response OmpR family regulator